MTYFIVPIAIFALFMLCFFCERKEKKRKECEEWIYRSGKHLRSISDRFESECLNVTEETFEKYCWNIRFCEWYCNLEQCNSLLLSEHERIIDTLKKDYIENLADKFSGGYAYRGIDRLPAYLIEEYNQRIKDITYRYHHINSTMMMRIRTMSHEHPKDIEIETT